MNKKALISSALLFSLAACAPMEHSEAPAGGEDAALIRTRSALSEITGTLQSLVDEEYYIPDFSRCGYHYSDEPIPYVPVFRTLTVTDTVDMKDEIQAAILEAEANGGGAILLKAGTYNISGCLKIGDNKRHNVTGVVLRGEGPGKTIIRHTNTLTDEGTCIAISTRNMYGGNDITPGDSVSIADDYTPVGRMYVRVTDASSFSSGDLVYISIPVNLDWINCIKMDQIYQDGSTVQWSDTWYEGKRRRYPRVVEYVDGDKVYLDHPVVRAIEHKHTDSFGKEYDFGGGWLVHYTEVHPFTKECGVENLSLTAPYDPSKTQTINHKYIGKPITVHNDSYHCHKGVVFTYCRNCWMRDVESTVLPQTMQMGVWAMQCQVENCRNLHPVDSVTGSHLYAFNMVHLVVGGLVKDCYCTHSRHSFVSSGDIIGPAVYLRCVSDSSFAETGPHSSYCTGFLYDNVISRHYELEAYDRATRGSGQGWTAGNMIMWNCEAPVICCQDPWTTAHNWAVGCIGTHQGGHTTIINYHNFKGEDADHPYRPDGVWYSPNVKVEPESLFESQLAARHSLGELVFGSTGEMIREIVE